MSMSMSMTMSMTMAIEVWNISMELTEVKKKKNKKKIGDGWVVEDSLNCYDYDSTVRIIASQILTFDHWIHNAEALAEKLVVVVVAAAMFSMVILWDDGMMTMDAESDGMRTVTVTVWVGVVVVMGVVIVAMVGDMHDVDTM